MRARNARPYGSSKRYAHRFGVAVNPPACRNGNRVADGRRYLLLRAQRVLICGSKCRKSLGRYLYTCSYPKGNGVIRKRGETSCLPSCVPAAHSREYAVMIWHTRRAESWPRPASLAAARQFTFSRPTIPVCNGIVFSGRAMRAPTRCKRQTARRAAKSPARDTRAPSLPYLANILTAQGHYLRSIFTPFCAAAMNASTSSLVLNGANDTRIALSVRAFGRPSARSTPLCLPLEHAEPLDT